MGQRRLWVGTESRPLRRPFRIARGVRTEQAIISVHLAEGGWVGRGAATGAVYRGESVAAMQAQIERVRPRLEAGLSRAELQAILPPGGARAALDAALWELEAAFKGTTVAALTGTSLRALPSAYTIVLDDPAAMAAQAQQEAWRPLLKVKLGANDPREADRIRAVRQAAPVARLVADANAGWDGPMLDACLPVLAECGYDLIEQPLAIGEDHALGRIPEGLPICLDESFDSTADLAVLPARVTHVNIKLDKCGGLTEGLRIVDEARRRGIGVFVGCMLGPSEAVAPAQILAQSADFVDLDGPFWLKGEEHKAVLDEKGFMMPIAADVWGGGMPDA